MTGSSSPPPGGAIAEVAERFSGGFPAQGSRPRTVGREAEFPVVDAAGRAADVRRLAQRLAATGDLTPKYDSGNPNLCVELSCADYSYALEVGLGTVEVNTRPCRDLFEIQAIMAQAVGRLVRVALDFGWRVLGYGVQPVTPATLRLMTPKQRYQSLYRAMGQEWLWYAMTASDQVQVSVGRDEIVHMLNVGNLVTPVIIALCANSPVYNGRLSPYCSGREGQMAAIHASEHRHGMPVRPYTSIHDYVATVSESTYLIRRRDGEVIPSSRPFSDYLAEHGPDFDAFLYHEHYIWNSARLRVAYGTIEIRPACQQPWQEHMAAATLGLGLIEAGPQVDAYVQTALGPDYWEIMRRYHQSAVRLGLAAPAPAPDFLESVVDLARNGLHKRGRGEERLLAPIDRRLALGQNPAQRARRVFRIDGLAAMVAQVAIRPQATRPASS